MAQKIYDKKLKDLHSKRSTVISITPLGEIYSSTVLGAGPSIFYHEFFGPSKKIIHAQHVCVFMERIARYFFFWKGSPGKDHFLSGFSIRARHLETKAPPEG